MMQHGILRWVEGERGGWGGPQERLVLRVRGVRVGGK